MKPDLYTKAVLSVIALLLLLLACNRYVNPESKARAAGPFAQLQFTYSQGTYAFFDTNTGEIWQYTNTGEVYAKARLTKPGEPLAGACNNPGCIGK
jgi:hypothetical protein